MKAVDNLFNLQPLHIIFIADCSQSMSRDGKIQALNNALRELLPELKQLGQENNFNLLIRAVKFSDDAGWHIEKPTPVEELKWQDIEIEGFQKSIGKGLLLVSKELTTPPMPKKGYSPVLVLITDGSPTDDFEAGLSDLITQGWGRKSVRFLVPIGSGANVEILQNFIGISSMKPIQPNNIISICNYLKWTGPRKKSDRAFQSLNANAGLPESSEMTTIDIW
jgi:uncharacterized protein YegL